MPHFMQVRPRQLLELIVIVEFAMANLFAFDGSSFGRLGLAVMPPKGDIFPGRYRPYLGKAPHPTTISQPSLALH